MKIKKWLFHGLLFLQSIAVSNAIGRNSIVRLKCNVCEPHPEKCCIGTVIFADFILTTSYCALGCQYVKEKNQYNKIVEAFVNTNYKIVPQGKYMERNSVGIVVAKKSVLRKNSQLKLSALDMISAVGLKALVPVIDPSRPRLQVTVLTKCERKIRGFYICATKRPSQGEICHQDQGIPLLVQERVIGITIQISPPSCEQLQTIFMALDPYHSWIKSVISSCGYNGCLEKGVLREILIKDKQILSPVKMPHLRSSRDNSNETEISENSTLQDNINRTSKTLSYSNLTLQKKAHKTTVYSKNVFFNISKLKTNDIMTENPSRQRKEVKENSTTTKLTSSTSMSTSSTTITTKRDPRTAITANLDILTATTSNDHSATKINITTAKTTLPTTLSAAEPLTTSLMDWFRAKVKQNLKKGISPVLILTTPATEYYFEPSTFFDLT